MKNTELLKLIIHYVYRGNLTDENMDEYLEKYKEKFFFFGKDSSIEKIIPVFDPSKERVETLIF